MFTVFSVDSEHIVFPLLLNTQAIYVRRGILGFALQCLEE